MLRTRGPNRNNCGGLIRAAEFPLLGFESFARSFPHLRAPSGDSDRLLFDEASGKWSIALSGLKDDASDIRRFGRI
jgi:hypothetical protein